MDAPVQEDAFDRAVSFFLERYGQYRLEDIYRKNFKEGGLTYGQIETLTTLAFERDAEKMKFYAACHGADMDSPSTGETACDRTNLTTGNDPRFKGCVPGDPKSYAHLPEELQKEFLEKRMIEDQMFFSQAFGKI